MRTALALAFAALAAQSCVAVGPEPSEAPTPAPATAVAAEPTSSPTPGPPEPSASPTPPLPRCAAPERRIGPVELDALCVAGTEVAVERGIAEDDARRLSAQVQDDVTAVLHDFAWTLRGRPVIRVFATTASYTAGLVHAFGYTGATAAFVAENSVAFFEPGLRTILVNWDAVRERRPIAAIRHELTHFVALEACAPRCDLVPAWLNEGQARLAEALIPGGEWRLVRVRYEAASMVATKTLLPLPTLVSQGQWNSLTSWAGYYKYQEAARATELLREDIGGAQPIARLYERLRRGEDVARAYASLTGRSFDSFVTGLAARFADGVPAGPAIVTTAGPQAGHGVGYLLYGFGSEERLTLRVVGRRFEEHEEITVSPQGAHFAEIVDRYPPGTYVIAVTKGETVVASTRFEKRGGRPLYRLD
ncbi:MAG TPA: hypothetical protein VMQ78_11945 [Candidatus Limnocylindria bacterium]|nr:hypothetical protein [Candidatus Limnocylindria bacterium]